MRIKSFFAKSVDEAMTQARAQLGAEAMLLNTRKVPYQDGLPGGYEVVFGTVDEEPFVAKPAPEPVLQVYRTPPPQAVPEPEPEPVAIAKPVDIAKEAPQVASPAAPADHVADELQHLRAQMEEIRSLILRSSKNQPVVGRTVPELV